MITEFISPEMLGILLIGVMLFAIFIGFPISFTLIFLGFVFGYLGFGKLVFYLMTLQFSMVMTEQALAAVPLFVFMGIMMENAGLMERLFSAVELMLSRVRGALFYAVLFVSVIFAAATGIVGASVTILGIMAAKSMNKSGYDVKLSAGVITAGGTLGSYPTKYYVGCNGTNYGNSSHRLVFCSNYSWNYASCFICSLCHVTMLDGSEIRTSFADEITSRFYEGSLG